MITGIAGFTYDCKNAEELAKLYQKLLGLKEYYSGEGWAALPSPQGGDLSFQEIKEYMETVWHWKDGEQQQMAHLDFYVDNLEESAKYTRDNPKVSLNLQTDAKKESVWRF